MTSKKDFYKGKNEKYRKDKRKVLIRGQYVMHEKYFEIIDGSLTFEPHPIACQTSILPRTLHSCTSVGGELFCTLFSSRKRVEIVNTEIYMAECTLTLLIDNPNLIRRRRSVLFSLARVPVEKFPTAL